METSLYNLLPDRIVEHLTEKLFTEPDELKVDVIREGKQQESNRGPDTGFQVLIRGEDKSTPHTLSDRTQDAGTIAAPVYEIGGGRHYFLHYVIEMSFHFRSHDRDDARERAYVLLSRLKHALRSVPMEGLTDDFEETAVFVEPNEHHLVSSGGGKQWLWKGEQKVRVLTWGP